MPLPPHMHREATPADSGALAMTGDTSKETGTAATAGKAVPVAAVQWGRLLLAPRSPKEQEVALKPRAFQAVGPQILK